MSITIPERFLGSDLHLVVLHCEDMHHIDVVRMSLRALSDLVADGATPDGRVSIDRCHLAFLLDTIADKLEGIPEVPFKYLSHLRAHPQTQGA